MSLVGTRPILQDELLKYELHHRARIAIKPGITGMWQVSGRSDITDFEEVVRLDAHVLAMEQIMSTGGGWQDQVGGITSGLKYITSMPGLQQQLQVAHIELSPQTTVNFYKGDCVFVPADSEVLTIHGQAQFLDIRG